MKSQSEIEAMAKLAKTATGWAKDGTYVPVGRLPGEGEDDEDNRAARNFAEGVEAGLLWALGWAGPPFTR